MLFDFLFLIGLGLLHYLYCQNCFQKVGFLILSMKFLSPEVALYLYKSTIRPCMEYCCYVRAFTPSYYLELLDKLQKRICRAVGPLPAASLELLHCIKSVQVRTRNHSIFVHFSHSVCSS